MTFVNEMRRVECAAAATLVTALVKWLFFNLRLIFLKRSAKSIFSYSMEMNSFTNGQRNQFKYYPKNYLRRESLDFLTNVYFPNFLHKLL